MKGKIARVIAVAVASSVLALVGAGVASAGGKGTSSTQAAGQQLLQMRDDLARAAYGGDVAGTQRMLGQMTPLLGDLAAGQKYTIQSDAQQEAGVSRDYGSETSRVLADPTTQARELPRVQQLPDLPDLPPPLNIVTNLLKSLLSAVTGLLSSLLGSASALPLPSLPVPVPKA
ncbi:MAG TPA: hypothetical protein VJ870_15175 [Amycolatopsis sp.]|nr:hypothetical protein [Amycolatopsis sp.]